MARASGFTLFVTPSAAVFALGGGHVARDPLPSGDAAPAETLSADVLRVVFAGAQAATRVEGLEELPGKVNSFRGADPAAWRTSIPTFARVACRDVHPGIDLVYYGAGGALEFDFVVRAGADPRAIRLRYEGADSLATDERGDLTVGLAHGSLVQRRPDVYQDTAGGRRTVSGRYEIVGRTEVAFVTGDFDRTCALVIDPVLHAATYLGGTDADYATGVAVTPSGDLVVCGYTSSPDFPITAGAVQPAIRTATDAFVARLSPDGSTLRWATYLGASKNTDLANDVAVDAAGDVYVVGETNANDFPGASASPIRSANPLGRDGFVVKLAGDGSSLLWSTYIGGTSSGYDVVQADAVPPDGEAVVAGTQSLIHI